MRTLSPWFTAKLKDKRPGGSHLFCIRFNIFETRMSLSIIWRSGTSCFRWPWIPFHCSRKPYLEGCYHITSLQSFSVLPFVTYTIYRQEPFSENGLVGFCEQKNLLRIFREVLCTTEHQYTLESWIWPSIYYFTVSVIDKRLWDALQCLSFTRTPVGTVNGRLNYNAKP